MDKPARIPRIIHYCWFGKGAKPRLAERCIESWSRHLPGYTIMEWNEDNFDVGMNPYVREAYAARKYAFVSDYARLHALYTVGGIYMDTDVEVLKPLDRFLEHEAFSGFEDEHFLQSGTMGAAARHPWIRELLDDYEKRSFIQPGGTYDTTTNTSVISQICGRQGLELNGQLQTLASGVVFYPRTYFSPYDYINGGNYITEDSYTIHHFAQSWLPYHVRLRSRLKKTAGRVIGQSQMARIRKLFS